MSDVSLAFNMNIPESIKMAHFQFTILNYSRMKKHIKKIILVMFCFFPVLLFSGSIDTKQLMKYAVTAFQQKEAANTGGVISGKSIKSVDYLTDGKDTLMLLLNFDPSGFVLFSAKEVVRPVLAYSLEGYLSLDDLPSPVQYWMDEYKEGIHQKLQEKAGKNPQVEQAWEKVKRGGVKGSTSEGVKPLVKALWTQKKYYNTLCPISNNVANDFDNHHPNGCVALAMSMILYYYRYPLSGEGSNTNNRYKEEPLFVDFSEQEYHYDLMEDELSSYNHEVAKLIYHSGIAVNTLYTEDASGATSSDAAAALKDYFKYSNNIKYSWRLSYGESQTKQWIEMLVKDLDQGRPILYGGRKGSSGHAFLCDGYDSDTLFHFNLGWGKSGEGYYDIRTSSNAPGGYSNVQSAVTQIYPREIDYPAYCGETRLLTASRGTLEDGSNYSDYRNNSNCTFIIAPPQASSIEVVIQELQTEEDHDVLTFWKGDPSKGERVASYSGSISDKIFKVNTDSLYITFSTNDSITDKGWRLSYKTHYATSPCEDVVRYRAQTGVLTDGSGDNLYRSNLNCSWILFPSDNTEVEYINLSFTLFELAAGDHIYIYDISSNTLLDLFDATHLPPVSKRYDSRYMRIEFNTDNYLSNNGFKIEWVTNLAEKIDSYKNKKIHLYPNPARNQVVISLPEEGKTDWELSLFQLSGVEVHRESIPFGEREHRLNLANFSPGIYGVQLKNRQSVYTGKFVIIQ